MLNLFKRHGAKIVPPLLKRVGSCTEIVVPDNVEIFVKKGDKVRGGESVIGRIKNS